MATLAERLGYSADEKLLIVTADDLGLCHAANVGVYDCLRTGLVTSASLMVPCPWAREAAARYRGEDIGVLLTFNAEWELYRWGPVTQAPSLLGGEGGFPRTVQDVWDHADLDEVRRECRAQIERAILWGFDVSHLDTHLGTLQHRPEFFDVYLDMAVEFGLPVHVAGLPPEHLLGFPARALADGAGAIFPDHVLSVNGATTRAVLAEALWRLEPGVTEVHLRPAVPSSELRAIADDWERRVDDHRLVCEDGTLRKVLDETGVTLLGYRPLRDLVRGSEAGRARRMG
ncbi:MAG: polysaccharide deacetylase family protein [Acidimicrobiales bacterium]